MALSDIFMYVWLFISLFFEIFLLITYFEIRDDLKREEETLKTGPSSFPSTTIIVPCFNEEKTVLATIESLLALDYPKEKLSLLVVDDGSTDNTKKVVEENYSNHPQIQIFSKENGGKHTALNFALEKINSELVGCLDADSFVDSQALKRMVPFFEREDVMAVVPSVKIHEPQSLLQYIQRVEYSWGVFLRRVLASLNALYVTPGPFSIFKTSVFEKIGGYRHAHHTEDMEMALRLQKHGFRIVNSHSASVYTVGPAKLKTLYKQRVRWTYGFLNNVMDYKEMFFNKRFGNIGIFILPIATFSVFAIIYMSFTAILELVNRFGIELARFEAVGWSYSLPKFSNINWFAFNTGTLFWISITILALTLFVLSVSLKISKVKTRSGRDVLYYFCVYLFIVPLWLTKAAYSTITRRQITWR